MGGLPCIKKSAEFLQTHGIRKALMDRGNNGTNDYEDVSDDPTAVKLYTMSPIPNLIRGLKNPFLKSLSSQYAALEAKEELIAEAKSLIESKNDPVARFHT